MAVKSRRRCHERRQGIIIMYPWNKQCACDDKSDDQIIDLSLCDVKRLRNYLRSGADTLHDYLDE
eukprot:5485599-Heterocapsa_arctica.AAC.1